MNSKNGQGWGEHSSHKAEQCRIAGSWRYEVGRRVGYILRLEIGGWAEPQT